MKKLITIVALGFSIAALNAEEAGLQLSLTPDVALKSRDTTIRGLSLNIWGENPQRGVALGLINGSTGESGGFTWAFLGNYAESYTGVAWGLVNYSTTTFVGWQGGAVNYAQGDFTGLQSGFVNVALNCSGLQLGAVNYAENLHGVQVGFLNVVKSNPWFSEFPDKLALAFPFVNWSF